MACYSIPEVIGDDSNVAAREAEVCLSVHNRGGNPGQSRVLFRTQENERPLMCGTVYVTLKGVSTNKGLFIDTFHHDFFCVVDDDEATEIVNLIPQEKGTDWAALYNSADADPAAFAAVLAAAAGDTTDWAATEEAAQRNPILGLVFAEARQRAAAEASTQVRTSVEGAQICYGDEEEEAPDAECEAPYNGPTLLHYAVRQGREGDTWAVLLLSVLRQQMTNTPSGTSAQVHTYVRRFVYDGRDLTVTTEGMAYDRAVPREPGQWRYAITPRRGVRGFWISHHGRGTYYPCWDRRRGQRPRR